MKVFRKAALASIALALGVMPIATQADAAQYDCAVFRWCDWDNTGYNGAPSHMNQTDVTLTFNFNYKSWWNRHSLSLTQKTTSNGFVGCTLPNYGTGGGNRYAAQFIFNDSQTC